VVAQVAAQRHGQHAGARCQQASGAAAPALDEVFDGEALGRDQVQVFVEYGGIEEVALEAAAQEEGARAPHHGADDRDIEVGAGGDVRRHQAAMENYIGQQQVVDVAAVAGHIDDFVVMRGLAHAFKMVDLDAVVEPGPQPGQEDVEDADHRIGIVGGDFVGVAACTFHGFFWRNAAGLRFLAYGLLHRRCSEQAVHQRAPVRKVGADGDLALAVEMHAQNTRQLAQGDFLGKVFGNDFPYRNRCAEFHESLAAVHEDGDELPERAGRGPGVGEEQLEDRAFLVRRAAPEDGHRHQLHVQLRVRPHGFDQAYEARGMLEAVALQGRGIVAAGEEEQRAVFLQWCPLHGAQRARQAGLAGFRLQHQQVGEEARLQHIADRPGGIDLQLFQVFRQYGGAHEHIEEFARDEQEDVAEPLGHFLQHFDVTGKIGAMVAKRPGCRGTS
jgi:hypothetical protein